MQISVSNTFSAARSSKTLSSTRAKSLPTRLSTSPSTAQVTRRPPPAPSSLRRRPRRPRPTREEFKSVIDARMSVGAAQGAAVWRRTLLRNAIGANSLQTNWLPTRQASTSLPLKYKGLPQQAHRGGTISAGRVYMASSNSEYPPNVPPLIVPCIVLSFKPKDLAKFLQVCARAHHHI